MSQSEMINFDLRQQIVTSANKNARPVFFSLGTVDFAFFTIFENFKFKMFLKMF